MSKMIRAIRRELISAVSSSAANHGRALRSSFLCEEMTKFYHAMIAALMSSGQFSTSQVILSDKSEERGSPRRLQ